MTLSPPPPNRDTLCPLSPLQEPDSTLLISGAMHRDWPDARGMFVNEKKNALVWVNEEDHMRVISMEMGHDIVNVFKRFVDLCNNVSGS